MAKNQVSVELIIIATIVLIISLISIYTFTNYSLFSKGLDEKNLKMEWNVNNPIGITSWLATQNGTYIHFINNIESIIRINSITIDGKNYLIDRNFAQKEIIKFKANETYAFGKYNFDLQINYSYLGTEGEYMIDKPLQGTASLTLIDSSGYILPKALF
jgi:hypothetical protein